MQHVLEVRSTYAVSTDHGSAHGVTQLGFAKTRVLTVLYFCRRTTMFRVPTIDFTSGPAGFKRQDSNHLLNRHFYPVDSESLEGRLLGRYVPRYDNLLWYVFQVEHDMHAPKSYKTHESGTRRGGVGGEASWHLGHLQELSRLSLRSALPESTAARPCNYMYGMITTTEYTFASGS